MVALQAEKLSIVPLKGRRISPGGLFISKANSRNCNLQRETPVRSRLAVEIRKGIKNPQTRFPYYRQPIIWTRATLRATGKWPGAAPIKDIRSTLDTTRFPGDSVAETLPPASISLPLPSPPRSRFPSVHLQRGWNAESREAAGKTEKRIRKYLKNVFNDFNFRSRATTSAFLLCSSSCALERVDFAGSDWSVLPARDKKEEREKRRGEYTRIRARAQIQQDEDARGWNWREAREIEKKRATRMRDDKLLE